MPVQLKAIEVTIEESGTVELSGQQVFKAPSDVTVEAVLIRERQRVRAGDALLILRDRKLQRELDTQLVQNQVDENTLKRRLEIVKEREAKAQEKEARNQESRDLADKGYISVAELQRDKDDLDTARSAVKDAQTEVTNASLKVKSNQVITDNLRKQLADNKIVAPIDAMVLKVEVKPGDGIQQEGRLLTIGDPQKEMIRLQLSPLNASKIGTNMPIRARVIGPNPKVYPGKISQISPQALSQGSTEGKNANSTGQSKVEVEAMLDRPSNELIPGSAVSVEIVLQQRKNVVVAPLSTLQSEGGSFYVWVRDQAGNAQKRAVTVGLQNLESAEIVSGLQRGDELIVSLPSNQELIPGAPVEKNKK
ncbi:HlyD family efflux transporter periplasmic adaptor subunit [Cyanobacteria bacterium FACHB-63]|nr:HlyD family efflux transporter periplasmic adaptor subunit [Cyanobacteria bacterium FACHB-63]